jgi:hypothetical protein
MKKKSAKTVSKKVKLSLGKEIMSFAIVGLLLLPGVMSVPAAEAREPICTASVMCALQSLGFESSLTNEGDLRDDIQLIRARLNQMFALLNALNAIVQERNGVASNSGMYANITANGSNGPIQIASGSDVLLSWTSAGASSCKGTSNQSATAEWGMSVPTNGSQTIPNVTKSTVFRIGCNVVIDKVVVNVTGQQEAEDKTPIATINEDTLTSSLSNPTISGKAWNIIPQFGISLSNAGGKIWGSDDIEVEDNVWSVNITEDLGVGSYTVNVYSDNVLLTSGTLTITSAESGNPLPASDDDEEDPFDLGGNPAPVPTVTVTAPNSGENWVFGTQQTISWTSINTTGAERIRIRLVDPSGDERKIIIRDTENDGQYTWTVGQYEGGPATAGQRYNIKVCIKGTADTDAVCDRGNTRFTMQVAPIAQADQASLMAAAGSVQSILDSLNSLLRLRY